MIKRVLRRTLPFLILFVFIASCVSAQPNNPQQSARYSLIPEYPRPGEPVTIAVTDTSATHALLFVGERQVARTSFFNVPAENGKPGFMATVITIPATVSHGSALYKINSADGLLMEIPFIIASRNFEAEVIHLNERLTGIRTDPSPQRTEEANLLWNILITTGNQIYHSGPFIPPVVATRRTSFFGDRRVFQYSTGRSDTSIHAGVDYGVPTGTRVDACGAGRVVLARMRIVTGNSVVIEHAPGIYSLYYHLDSISVREGAIIATGTQIGLSGSTGLSTGPHLHWEIRVGSENTDPDAFVTRQIIDKDLILSRLFN
jgi:murein DD-endopeptidase MepM/ murein hydrolase activator NlpD